MSRWQEAVEIPLQARAHRVRSEGPSSLGASSRLEDEAARHGPHPPEGEQQPWGAVGRGPRPSRDAYELAIARLSKFPTAQSRNGQGREPSDPGLHILTCEILSYFTRLPPSHPQTAPPAGSKGAVFLATLRANGPHSFAPAAPPSGVQPALPSARPGFAEVSTQTEQVRAPKRARVWKRPETAEVSKDVALAPAEPPGHQPPAPAAAAASPGPLPRAEGKRKSVPPARLTLEHSGDSRVYGTTRSRPGGDL